MNGAQNILWRVRVSCWFCFQCSCFLHPYRQQWDLTKGTVNTPKALLGPSFTRCPKAGWSHKPLRGHSEQRVTAGYWACCCRAPRAKQWPMRWRSCLCSPHKVCLRSTNAKMVRMWMCCSSGWAFCLHLSFSHSSQSSTWLRNSGI